MGGELRLLIQTLAPAARTSFVQEYQDGVPRLLREIRASPLHARYGDQTVEDLTMAWP
jgi:hypothetical protein